MNELIPAALDGQRIDRVIAMLSGRSRAEVADVIASGVVVLDGLPVLTKSAKVAEGQRLEVELQAPRRADELIPDPSIELAVVHEAAAFVVIDKPAGLVVHPGAGHAQGTMVHALLARYPEMASVGEPDRPGIVHRLDRGTSGLLVVARTAAGYSHLVDQLSSRSVERRYTAMVVGEVEGPAGLVDAPIGRGEGDKTRMAVTMGGREARTAYEVTGRFTHPIALTELDCRLETGRTHQVRVHLAAIGHPVLGDAQYGGERPAVGLDRPFLHARHLGFIDPDTGGEVSFDSALASDLEATRAGFS
ncbi:MAG: RluA family pseudouridine synthase [Acidimicrobiales bacterium]